MVTYLRASTPHLPNSLPLLHFFTPVAQLLYQEYSDVFLNKEIQSQQRLDSLTEAPGPISPRQPRKALVSSESYLHRLSMASSGSLWQEIPVVRNSTVLLSMTHEDQKLQEVPPGGVGQGLRKGKRGLLCSRLSPTQHPHPHHHLLLLLVLLKQSFHLFSNLPSFTLPVFWFLFAVMGITFKSQDVR